MNPLLSAEQAVLGSVLLDPHQLVHLDWLAPEDFYRPAHQALFAALRKLRTDGHPALATAEAVPLSWVSDTVDEASHHVRGLSALYAHTLISACPRPGHASVYGRMVLEGAIRRSVTEHATRLHQAARADARRGEIAGALHHADILAGILDDLARRWGADPCPATSAPPPAMAAAGAPPLQADQVPDDERFLLAVLAQRPEAMDQVIGLLWPGDFADTAHGHLYRCLGALHHRGEPIDRITVLWEAQRRGLLADGTLTAEEVTAVCDGDGPGSADWLSKQILRASVTRTAEASARPVRVLAGNAALSPGQLASHARHALEPLDAVRLRWQTANGRPAPKPPPSAQPTDKSRTARTHAARSRSAPPRSAPSSERPGPAPVPTSPRPASRAHG